MKNTLLLLFLFWFAAAVGQQVDTCNIYSKKNINRYYDMFFVNPDSKIDVKYFEQFITFTLDDTLKMQKLKMWAETSGYTVWERESYCNNNGEKEIVLNMERLVNDWDLKKFEKIINELSSKLKNLKISMCNVSGVAIAKESVSPK